MKVCSETGCPVLVDKAGKCPQHRRTYETQRGTRQARGYDRAYELQRNSDARTVAAGKAICWCCDQRISPLEPWDEGHCDNDKAIIHGPQRRACNRDTTTLGACKHPTHRVGGDP